jgi:hypothetical protein
MQRMLIGFGLAGLALIVLAWIVMRSAGPDTQSVASATLKGIREQNRLTTIPPSSPANRTVLVSAQGKR